MHFTLKRLDWTKLDPGPDKAIHLTSVGKIKNEMLFVPKKMNNNGIEWLLLESKNVSNGHKLI